MERAGGVVAIVSHHREPRCSEPVRWSRTWSQDTARRGPPGFRLWLPATHRSDTGLSPALPLLHAGRAASASASASGFGAAAHRASLPSRARRVAPARMRIVIVVYAGSGSRRRKSPRRSVPAAAMANGADLPPLARCRHPNFVRILSDWRKPAENRFLRSGRKLYNSLILLVPVGGLEPPTY